MAKVIGTLSFLSARQSTIQYNKKSCNYYLKSYLKVSPSPQQCYLVVIIFLTPTLGNIDGRGGGRR